MKNLKVKIKNEDGAGGREAGETPMFAGRKAGSAVSPGSVETAVSGVGSGPSAEGEKEEIGEKAPKSEVSSADAEALADKSFKFLVSSGENNRTGRTQGTDGNAAAIGDLKFQISEQEKNEDGSKAKHQMEEKEAPLPGPLPTPRTCGEGDDCTVGGAERFEDAAADAARTECDALPIGNLRLEISKQEEKNPPHYFGSHVKEGGGSGGAGIGDLKFQISKEEKGDADHFPKQEGQIVQLCSPLFTFARIFGKYFKEGGSISQCPMTNYPRKSQWQSSKAMGFVRLCRMIAVLGNWSVGKSGSPDRVRGPQSKTWRKYLAVSTARRKTVKTAKIRGRKVAEVAKSYIKLLKVGCEIFFKSLGCAGAAARVQGPKFEVQSGGRRGWFAALFAYLRLFAAFLIYFFQRLLSWPQRSGMWLVFFRLFPGHYPFTVMGLMIAIPGVAPSSQPWAPWRNAVGVLGVKGPEASTMTRTILIKMTND